MLPCASRMRFWRGASMPAAVLSLPAPSSGQASCNNALFEGNVRDVARELFAIVAEFEQVLQWEETPPWTGLLSEGPS